MKIKTRSIHKDIFEAERDVYSTSGIIKLYYKIKLNRLEKKLKALRRKK